MQVPLYGQPAQWAFLQQRQVHAAQMAHQFAAAGGPQPPPIPGGMLPGDAYHAFMAAAAGGRHGGGAHFAGGHLRFGGGVMR